MSGSTALAVTANRRNDWPAAVRDLNQNAPGYPRNEDELHGRLVKWFEEAEEAGTDGRRRSQRDRAYVNGDQWTREEMQALEARGQPAIVINYCRRKLSLLCGLERKARTDPKAYPRTPTEEERADAATQALRFIADDNDYSVIRSQVFEEILVEGFGGVELTLRDDGKGGADIIISWVPWDRIWFDPHSRQPDFLDSRYKGLVIWMDREAILELWPGAEDVVDATFSREGISEYRDRPDSLQWTDNQRTRCRVVVCYWVEGGVWYNATYTRAGFLSTPQQSKFKDKRGKSGCGLILQSGYVDLENNRYGMVRDLVSLQDEINKRRSKALHLLAVHQVIAEQGAVEDVDKARREVAKPDGFVEIMPGMKFEINDGSDLAVGQFKLLEHATAEMQLSGPNAAMSGTDPRELSGRAILAQQAGGATQNEPLADSLRMWSRRVYEMCWMAAREVWSGGKWVRITDDLQDTRWIGINRPVTLQDELAEMEPQERAEVMQRLQLVPDDPRLQQVIRIENDITDLDVDITIAEGQDVPALQAETFQTLVQLASVNPGLIPPDVLIAASSLRDKEDILKRLKETQEEQAQIKKVVAGKEMEAKDADTLSKRAKAEADFALAQERKVNSVKGVHEVHSAFAAPPYGQPFAAPPDNAVQAQPQDPTQMTPEMAVAHHMAELAKKQAEIGKVQADTQKTRTDTAVAAAQIPKVMHETAQTAVTTNRLARSPLPKPATPK